MRTKNFFRTLTIAMCTTFTMAGCGLVNDDEEYCQEVEPTSYQVRFRYDMNMKFADAFAHEVHAVTLLVLDEDGNLVWRGHESGSALAEEGYAMTVPVAPGNYQLLAWCTTNEQDTYNIDTSGRSIEGYTCSLVSANSRGYTVGHDLDPLYHGLVSDASFPDTPGTHTVTVPLTKDTNRVRVVLQHISGEPFTTDQFSFQIEADNAVLNYDNSVVTGHTIVYTPWHTEAATTGDVTVPATEETADEAAADSTTTTNMVNVMLAELTMNRLVVGDNPRLTVTNNETGEVVFSIPVEDYALLVKGYENAQMDDQEYLDRQDEYNMTFFLDERDRWFSAYIYINSWRIVLNSSKI